MNPPPPPGGSPFLPPRGLPALVLGATVSIATYAIYYSHRQQVVDRAAMREGVERDRERLRSMRRSRRGEREDD
jgi:hypothetical protein